MKVDVVVLTYGEPVRNTFREQWTYSNRILDKLTRVIVPIPKFAVPALGAWRGRIRTKQWNEEGYASPLEPVTENQSRAIAENLKAMAPDNEWRVHTAYEFRDPQLSEVLERLEREGCERLVFVPMYLAVSDFTNIICWRDFETYRKRRGSTSLPLPRIVFFRPVLHGLAKVMGDFIEARTAESLNGGDPGDHALLLGCHGTLVHPPKKIKDAGYIDTIKTYRLLEERFAGHYKAVRIGWLNHTLGGEWTEPNLEQTVKGLLEQGIGRFIYYPFGFLADNAESQLEGKGVMADLGVDNYIHLPCINEDPAFLRFVTQAIIDKTGGREPSGRGAAAAA